jgi:Glycosyl transferases group 1
VPPSLLWIVPKSPVPATDGARVATYNLMHGVLAKGARINLVVVPTAQEASCIDLGHLRRELPISEVTVLPRPTSLQGISRYPLMTLWWARRPHFPLTVAPFLARGVAQTLTKLIREFRGDAVVYDGLHVAAHLSSEKPGVEDGVRYVLRAHNKEAELWRRRAAVGKSWLERRLFLAQSKAMMRFEHYVVRHARGVATVSDHDRALFLREMRDLPPDRIATVPIGYDFGSPPPFPHADPWRLLFVGRLDWPPNRAGLKWFLDEVWPRVEQEAPRWSITIGGSGDGGWLRAYRHLSRLDLRGFVDDLAGLYAEASLAVVPLFVGSGIRVKVIEAGRYSRPCLSTGVGVEGLGLSDERDYFRAETAQEWQRCLITVTPNEMRVRGEQARECLRARYEMDAAASAFLTFVSRVAGGP